jgi:hypothetical protein
MGVKGDAWDAAGIGAQIHINRRKPVMRAIPSPRSGDAPYWAMALVSYRGWPLAVTRAGTFWKGNFCLNSSLLLVSPSLNAGACCDGESSISKRKHRFLLFLFGK